MPVLDNARHERFAQELAKGKTADEAYSLAGFSANRGNAVRLKANESVSARVIELKAAAADDTICTIRDIATQLDEDRQFAKECEAPSACVAATMGKAKVLGFLTDKVRLTDKDGDDLLKPQSEMDTAQAVAFLLAQAGKAKSQPTIQ
jgi:phage terminase small subunit